MCRVWRKRTLHGSLQGVFPNRPVIRFSVCAYIYIYIYNMRPHLLRRTGSTRLACLYLPLLGLCHQRRSLGPNKASVHHQCFVSQLLIFCQELQPQPSNVKAGLILEPVNLLYTYIYIYTYRIEIKILYLYIYIYARVLKKTAFRLVFML